jgi:HlyD family secretion protein
MTMNKNRNSKIVLWLGVGLAGATGAGLALRPAPAPVNTVLVAAGPLAASVTGEGRTRVKDLYVVAAPVDGEVQRVTVQPGDAVEVDSVVAELRPAASPPLDPRTRAQAVAALEAAKANVARAEAAEREAQMARQHAEAVFAEAQKLAATAAGPRAEAEHRGHEIELRLRAAEAATAAAMAARAELSRAQAALGTGTAGSGHTVTVRAPAAGKILRILRESAGPVAAGMPLLELGDVARIEVKADLLSSDAASVRPGARATITGWGGAEAITARVRRIDPAAFTKVSALGLEEQRVYVVLDLVEPPPPALGHDYRVDAGIVVWEAGKVLRVPSTALFRVGDRWAVFLVRNGRARRTLVDTGPSDGTWTMARAGVQAGDTVIVQPSDVIADGARVASLGQGAP